MRAKLCFPWIGGGLLFLGISIVVTIGCSHALFSGEESSEEARSASSPPALSLDRDASPNPLRAKAAPASSAERVTTVAVGETKSPKDDREPFDPIKANGEFFKGWPKPQLALVLTGCEDGYFEPCGCAGLDRMKGGLSRRHTMLEDLRQKGWPILVLDVGGMIKGWGKQAALKFQITVSAMRKMNYDVIGLGKNDLKLPTEELVSYVASINGKESPFVSANVGLFGFDAGLTPQKRVVKAGGFKIGVTSVLGKKYQGELHNNDIQFLDPEQAIQKALPELRKEQCDLLVLLSHATVEESTALAKKFPEFNVVVTAGGPPEPPIDMPPVVGRRTRVIEVGEKGMNAIVLGYFNDPQTPVRYQRVVLDSRYKSSPDIVALMAEYQDRLKDEGLAGLGVRAMPGSRADLQGKYVGSQKCESCHEESYRVWKKSGHSWAYKTLVKASPPRNFDPECIACHVVGWHPSDYRPYVGGFLDREKTPHLTDVGCESCHGPGEAHVQAEMPGSKLAQAQIAKLRQAMVVTKADAEKHLCVTCHDLDNSPDFNFKTYWPKVEHHEK